MLTKIKTIEEVIKEKETTLDGLQYLQYAINGRTEEIVTKINEIVEYLNDKESNKEINAVAYEDLSKKISLEVFEAIKRRSR